MLLSEEDEAITAAAAAAPEVHEEGAAKKAQHDIKPKAKQKGTFSSLLSKQNMHRKGSSGKAPGVKGMILTLLLQ